MAGKVTLSGVLLDPLNKPLPGVHIELKSVKTGDVISGLAAEFVTNQDGSYSVEVPVGSYKCAIVVKDRETSLPGYVNVYEYSGAGTLNEYLYAPCQEDGEPMFIVQWEMIRQEIKGYNDNIEGLASQVKVDADRAESAADLAVTSVNNDFTFDDTASGLAVTTNGQRFRTQDLLNDMVIWNWWKNDNGSATFLGSEPDEKAIEKVLSLIGVQSGDDAVAAIVSILGYAIFTIGADSSFGTKLNRISSDGLKTKNVSFMEEGSDSFSYVDSLGRGRSILDKYGNSIAQAMKKGGIRVDIDSDRRIITLVDSVGRGYTIVDENGYAKTKKSEESSSFDVSSFDLSNKAYTQKVKYGYNPKIQRFIFDICHIIFTGQSLSTFQEGFPALTKVADQNLDNYMIGNSSRPASRTAANFTPIGGNVLNPLIAVVQSPDGSTVLSDSQVSALPAGSVNEGEGGVACVNFLKSMILNHYNKAKDESMKFVLSNCGVNGRTIEALSKGATPEIYNRIREAVSICKDIATGENKTYGVSCVFMAQGEWNYGNYGGSNLRSDYVTNATKYVNDINSDFGTKDKRIPFFSYQTSASFTSDTYELAIGMAQLDLEKNIDEFFVCCPSYPMMDKGGHLTCNGYRWLDMHYAKVAFRVMVLGEGWESMKIIDAIYSPDDNAIYVGYHAPVYPITFSKPFIGRNEVDYQDKGFRVQDSSGFVNITSVEIVADTVLKISIARSISGTMKIWYADKTVHNGNGCITDSDNFNSMYNYEYKDGSGQYPDENISSMVDKPYPLKNWAVAQVFTKEI